MEHLCFAAKKNCYAIMYSCGEICVGCNCCGRKSKGLSMYEARLKYQKSELDRNVNFNQWAVGFSDIIQMQKANVKSNIEIHKKYIKSLECKINKIKTNEV